MHRTTISLRFIVAGDAEHRELRKPPMSRAKYPNKEYLKIRKKQKCYGDHTNKRCHGCKDNRAGRLTKAFSKQSCQTEKPRCCPPVRELYQLFLRMLVELEYINVDEIYDADGEGDEIEKVFLGHDIFLLRLNSSQNKILKGTSSPILKNRYLAFKQSFQWRVKQVTADRIQNSDLQ